MSYKSSKPSGERSNPSLGPTTVTTTSSHPGTQTTTRKRSNTKQGIQLPTIHLSLKTSSSTLSSQARGGVGFDYDIQRATSRAPKRSPGTSPSTASPSPGRSAGYSPSSLGTNKSVSPLTASPDRQSLLPDPVSSSLPVSLSALSSEPSLELAQPSPSSVSSMRRPSTQETALSPFARGAAHAMPHSRSTTNLRAAATAARLANDPASRKTSIVSIERDAGLHLDMKRLLSKPTRPVHSGASLSGASDSEGPRSPGASLARKTSAQPAPAPRDRGTTARRATDEGPTTLRKTPSRTVLRRKPSATRSNPATPTATTFQRPQPAPESPRPGSSSRRAPSEPVALRRQRSPPAHMTPASAVAHAYKQQEQRREALAEEMGHGSGAVISAVRAFDDGDEGGAGAYYTVFGGGAGRVVAVGSAEDSEYDIGYDTRFHTAPAGAKADGEQGHVSGVRSLSRKVSGRFKRTNTREPSPYADAGKQVDQPYDGRQGRLPKPSMDEYVEIRSLISTGTAIPSAQNGTTERKDSQRGLRSMRSIVGKDPETKAEESSPGGKLWKLVKRISTGALRDKYHDTTPPPPVPALPDDFKHLAPSRTTFDIRKGRDDSSETGITRFMQSRTSLSAVRPSTAPQRGTPRTEHFGSRPSTGPRPSTTTRSSSPMSSDMASSKFFRKSHSVHSSISSYGEELPPIPGVGQQILTPGELSKLSSDVEESAHKKTRQRSRSRTRSLGITDAPRSATEPRPSLPPSRRCNTAGSRPAAEHDSDPPSPLIPTFETAAPTNNFARISSAARYSLPTSEFGVLSDSSAPPRPKRSARRKPPPFDLVSPTPTSPGPATPRSAGVPSLRVDVRKSVAGSVHSTLHSASPSSATTTTPPHARSPLRFREMDSAGPRAPLSEREKAAKWDDLLLRSEQAGGTLHIGEAGLMSDNIRFSDYSSLEA